MRASDESVALECDGPAAAPKSDCPLRCRLRHDTASDSPAADHASAGDQVDWAGLPVTLELAFSSNQRDRVYRQHLLRKRETRLSRWANDDPQLCARGNDCPLVQDGDRTLREIAAENRHPDQDAVNTYVNSLSGDKRYYRDVS
jgi:hypothetical protein